MNSKKNLNVPNLRFPEFVRELSLKKLEEISTWASGGTPSKENASFWNGTIPWISASSMHGVEYSNSNLKITEEGLKSGSKLAKKNTLLLLVRGSMLFNRIPVGITTKDVAFNQDVKSILIDDKKGNAKYILYWFFHSEQRIKHLVTGTGIGAGKLDMSDLKSLKVKLPTIPEQIKIATFLTSIDERINTQSKIIEDYKLLKKGIMQKIFNQELRFKDEKGNDFPEWNEKKISEIFEVTRGYVLAVSKMTQEPNNEYKYPVYSSQTKNTGLTGYYNEYLYENAITWTTDGANAGDVKYREGKFYCTNVSGVLICKKGNANLCIAEILNAITNRYVSYVGNPKLMNGVMSSIKIKFPSLSEQQKIAVTLSAIDKKIELETEYLTKLKTQKQYLLQNLFV